MCSSFHLTYLSYLNHIIKYFPHAISVKNHNSFNPSNQNKNKMDIKTL